MKHLQIDTTLKYRVIQRDMDTDYFIDTLSLPINLHSPISYLSRMQFPTARALLVRTSPNTSVITVHVLGDTDLYSSFINFEINLLQHTFNIVKENHCIDLFITPIN